MSGLGSTPRSGPAKTWLTAPHTSQIIAAMRGPHPRERFPSRGPACDRTAIIEGGILLVAYVMFTVWWLWPLPTVWRDHSAYFGAEYEVVVGDYYLAVWLVSWDTHALFTAPWHLFNANIFYPSRMALGYSEHLLGYVPLFAPVYAVTSNPVFAANVLIFSTYPLCAIAMYVLMRRWTASPAAALAGFVYAFVVFRYRSLDHFYMLGTFYFPLILLLTDRWFESARKRHAVLLAAALALQSLSSLYLTYALAVVYTPWLLIELWHWRARLDRRRIVGLATVAGVVGAVLIGASIPYLVLRQSGVIPSYTDDGTETPVGLVPYFANEAVWRYLTKQGVGSLGYSIALIGLAPPWRGHRRLVLVGLLLSLLGTLLAFGPGIQVGPEVYWSPFRWLQQWVPGFTSVRQPVRFVIVTQLGLAILIGLGMNHLVRRLRSVGWLVVTTIAVMVIWTFGPIGPIPMRRDLTEDRVPSAYRWLGAHADGRALLELPGRGFVGSGRRMYLSTYHWLPLVDGYGGYPLPTAAYIHSLAEGLPSEAALQELVDWVDIGWILVHRDEMPEASAAHWDAPLPPGLESIDSWGNDLLVRVTRPPVNNRRNLLLSTTRTIAGAPLGPLGEHCPGRIRVKGLPPMPWPLLTPVSLTFEITNDGADTWPGFAMYPRHLVRVEMRVQNGQGAPALRSEVPLPKDVGPGETVEVSVPMTTPLTPGIYTAVVELKQTGDAPLAACGVQPLRLAALIGTATGRRRQ